MTIIALLVFGLSLNYLSSTPEPPGPNGPSLFFRDTLCYVGTYAGVEILNLADPDSVRIVSHITTPGYTRHLDLDYPHLYVADDYNGLLVLDVSDPTRIQRVGHCPDIRAAYGVGHYGQFVYVGDWDDGLVVVDVSVPSEPVRVTNVAMAEWAQGFQVRYPYLYLGTYNSVSGTGSVRVFDISNPTLPVQVECETRTDFYCRDLAIRDSVLFACSALDGAMGPNLRLFDISDPEALVELGSYRAPNGAAVVDVALRDDDSLVFVSAFTQGLVVLDVTDPCNPTELATLRPGGCQSEGIAVQGQRVFLLQADPYVGMVQVDVTDPMQPVLLGNFSQGAFFYRSRAQSTIGYFCRQKGGIDLYDLSDLYQPTKVGFCPSQADAVLPSGGLLFSSNVVQRGLDVYDITDPTTPVHLASADTMLPYANLVRRGNVLYYVGGLRGLGNTYLVAVDVSDSTQPGVAGKALYRGCNYEIALDPARQYLYATQYRLLRVFGLADPFHPVEVAQCSLRGSGPGLVVRNRYVYVADYTEGLTVVDVADPTQPYVVGTYRHPLHNSFIDVAVIDSAAVVCNGSRGILLLNVADVTDIRLEDAYDTPESSSDVTTVRDSVFAVTDGAFVMFFAVPGVGIAETGQLGFTELPSGPTLVSAALRLGGDARAVLLDITGRRVMDLAPGENDVSRVAPGVYFVVAEQDRVVSKVILQR